MSVAREIFNKPPDPQMLMTAPSEGTVVAVLNSRWRVVHDALTWTLQYRAGNILHSDESDNRRSWQGKRFCRTRDALIRDARELCGDIDPKALTVIDALPDQHPDRVS
jgi:hypothetical protein